jgi:hypothetical protein
MKMSSSGRKTQGQLEADIGAAVRQFERVKPQLKERLEQITDCEVLNLVSVVGQDGMRFEALSKNFEN